MPRELVQDQAAETDLIGIWVYTFETWNEVRADRYLDALEHGIGKLVEDPTNGPGATSCARVRQPTRYPADQPPTSLPRGPTVS